ncbi:MAG: cysteine biosynthesis protein [Thermodesulfobacteria bacterium]|nr:cysteine biosynthesis protein [Thermodesulfobacteriota bacterium]
MTRPTRPDTIPGSAAPWISLPRALGFLLKSPRLIGWSLLLILLTGMLTWLGYLEAIHLVDAWTAPFFQHPPEHGGWIGWVLGKGWIVARYLFLAISRITAFYLAFLVAYCCTSPGYVFLASATEKTYLGNRLSLETRPGLRTILIDLLEGCKIGLVGLLVTVVALIINFVPVAGQGLVFLLYAFYSALMFIDYPASNRHWSLGRKIAWIRQHKDRAIRLGLLPALISLIPILNILLMALFFPLFTVHTTLNFIAVEAGPQTPTRDLSSSNAAS